MQVGVDGEWTYANGVMGGEGVRGKGRVQMISAREYTDDEIRAIAEREGDMFRPGVGVSVPKGVVCHYTGAVGQVLLSFSSSHISLAYLSRSYTTRCVNLHPHPQASSPTRD